MWGTIILPLVLTLSVHGVAIPKLPQFFGCDISQAKLVLPAGQTTLAQPNLTTSYIGLAFGTQNYTCGTNGKYTNIGAVAELFDISCFYNTTGFATLQDPIYALWELAPPTMTVQDIIALLHPDRTPAVLGQHYYVTNPITGSGINPKWDFTSQGKTRGNKNAFVVASAVAALPSPVNATQDITWVQLANIQGQLAQEVYRVDTVGGQPPASCTPGSANITVKYAAKYWLFGGSVKSTGSEEHHGSNHGSSSQSSRKSSW